MRSSYISVDSTRKYIIMSHSYEKLGFKERRDFPDILPQFHSLKERMFWLHRQSK
jgi:hypothetical protein